MKIDVRTRLLIAAIFSSLALVYQNPLTLAAALLLNIITAALFRLPLKLFWGFRKFIYIYLVLIIVQSFFVQSGEPLLKIGSVYLITSDGVLYGISITLRFLILLGSGLLLLTCNMAELLLALVKMRMPYEIVFMIQLGIRFIPVLISEMRNIFTAIQLRGVDLRKIYKRKVLRVYIGIFTPLIFGILQKAEQLSILLELRGFRRAPERTYYRSIKMSPADFAIMSLTVFATGLFIFGAAHLQKQIPL